jgi:cytochrome c peroxidase
LVALTAGDALADEASRLFEEETFGGNGRTCRSCHSVENGTLTLEQIAERHAEDPDDPLFLHDGSDDFEGNGASRILADGTILVRKSLPSNVHLLADLTATTVTLRRGIPTTMNTPALDPVLMVDGRAPNLLQQALDAINDHAQPTLAPTQAERGLIADFQETFGFFSSPRLFAFMQSGQPPRLPAGRTASERRGRAFFDNVPITAQSTRGICAICHSGPMLNENNGFNPVPIPPFFVPQGERFQSILSAELLPNGDPQQTFLVQQPGGSPAVVVHTDPGRALVTGDMRGFPFGDLGKFKIPSLWGVAQTAPYFHNNGAKTLEEAMDHYDLFFQIATPLALPGSPPLDLSEQDKADLVAFLRLL